MEDPLRDCSPLISAASCGKLRLVRLLVDGGAQVNGSNSRGALLAACEALRGEAAGSEPLKLLRYLLQNKADPNARAALMHACTERAGVHVAQSLLAAGADPCMEDVSGASALVYAINAQHQPTVQVLMDACQARGWDTIVITMEMGTNGHPVIRRYLEVSPSPDSFAMSYMSPSDIVLKTGSPNSSEEENIFSFRGTSRHGSGNSSRRSSCELTSSSPRESLNARPRILSEPWLAIQNLASLNSAYEERVRGRSQRGGRWPGIDDGRRKCVMEERGQLQRALVSGRFSFSPLTKTSWCPTPGPDEKLPSWSSSSSQPRRNTLPTLTVVPPSSSPPSFNESVNQNLTCRCQTTLHLPNVEPTCITPTSLLLCLLLGCSSYLLLQREGQEVHVSSLSTARTS
ncbi:ankyrin repeat domain-containing protein 34B [Nothobranchius furzeri]